MFVQKLVIWRTSCVARKYKVFLYRPTTYGHIKLFIYRISTSLLATQAIYGCRGGSELKKAHVLIGLLSLTVISY
jgi:hypothetical protein